jgi:hypothetical protein
MKKRINKNTKKSKIQIVEIKSKIIKDLRKRKIDGLLTAEIAKKYGLSVATTYRFMKKLYDNNFHSDCGGMLACNSGTEDTQIRHAHWFFT